MCPGGAGISDKKNVPRGVGTMQNSAEGRCTIPAPSRPPPPPGDSVDWCIIDANFSLNKRQQEATALTLQILLEKNMYL